jgi:hypothetical protein
VVDAPHSPTHQLQHAQSELNPNTNRLDLEEMRAQRADSFSVMNSRKQEEWLGKSKFISKETYYKVFSKYCQVNKFNLTDIYDPPFTLKEIKKIRRDRRRQQKMKNYKRKQVNIIPLTL